MIHRLFGEITHLTHSSSNNYCFDLYQYFLNVSFSNNCMTYKIHFKGKAFFFLFVKHFREIHHKGILSTLALKRSLFTVLKRIIR